MERLPAMPADDETTVDIHQRPSRTRKSQVGATVPYMDDQALGWQQWVPLVISGVALLVSVSGFLWGMLKHFHFDGGRVLVTIRPAIWNPGFSIFHIRSPAGTWRGLRESEGGASAKGVECAELVVENAGRTAVTVYGVGFTYTGGRRPPYRGRWDAPRWLRRRVRHSVSPRLFSQAGDGDERYRVDHQPFRLEPYDRAVYVLDVHSVIDKARRDRPNARRTVLRGFAEIAGTRAPARSAWRRRWRVPRETLTIVDFNDTVPAEVPIALILARHSSADETYFSSIEYAARLVAAGLWVHRDVSDLEERVKASFDYDEEIKLACGPASNMAQYRVRELITEHGSQLTWEGAQLQHRLHEQALASREAGKPQQPTPDGDRAEP